ncbi:MAG: phosphoadenosine phosphosulfate reductase family protein, partial [Verrucomicrobiota bacterium]
MQTYQISHLKQLEAESIFVLREFAAQFEKPVLLFSGGKDSIVMAWLARKAFWPARLPFPLLHVDTGHNFEETMTYRDKFVEDIRA